MDRRITLEHPGQVHKLVLVDSAGFPIKGTGVTYEQSKALNVSTIAEARAVLNLIVAHKQLVIDRLATEFLARHMQNNDGETINAFIDSIWHDEGILDGKLAGIHVPTLIVSGQQDGLTPFANAERFHRGIAGSHR